MSIIEQVCKEMELINTIKTRNQLFKELFKLEDEHFEKTKQVEKIQKDLVFLKTRAEEIDKQISNLGDVILDLEMEIGCEH